MMRNFIKEYFCFSRSERNGTVVLCFIVLFALLFPHFYRSFIKTHSYPAAPEFLAEIDAFYHNRSTGRNSVKFTTTDNSDSQMVKKVNVLTPFNDSLRSRTDLNSADTLELMQIKGIGPVLSRRILRYRDILGGYVAVDQLSEVYGIDGERFLEVSPFLMADTSKITRLNLLTGDFGSLLRHPYLDYEQVAQIFRLRQSGKLQSIEDLFGLTDFNESDTERLLPYLILDSSQ